jgi:hypothetical protein
MEIDNSTTPATLKKEIVEITHSSIFPSPFLISD